MWKRVSSRRLAGPGASAGAGAFRAPQRQRRAANTKRPADLPTKATPSACRVTASTYTEMFAVGVHVVATTGARLGRRGKANLARKNLQACDQAIQSRPHPVSNSARKEAQVRGGGAVGTCRRADRSRGATR